MMLNTDKSHLLISRHKNTSSRRQNLGIPNFEVLERVIDSQLKFDKHASNLCSKANKKARALERMIKIFRLSKKKKKRELVNVFSKPQFKYYT